MPKKGKGSRSALANAKSGADRRKADKWHPSMGLLFSPGLPNQRGVTAHWKARLEYLNGQKSYERKVEQMEGLQALYLQLRKAKNKGERRKARPARTTPAAVAHLTADHLASLQRNSTCVKLVKMFKHLEKMHERLDDNEWYDISGPCAFDPVSGRRWMPCAQLSFDLTKCQKVFGRDDLICFRKMSLLFPECGRNPGEAAFWGWAYFNGSRVTR